MFFDFSPWQLDVEVDLTKQLYKEADYSTDKAANTKFMESLSSEQRLFFDSLGIDLTKAEVDETIYDIPEDEELPAHKLKRVLVNFLIRGKILALPKYQKDLYSNEEMFGDGFPKSIKVLTDDEEYIKTFDNGIGIGIVFKHPGFHFDDEKFNRWDCGYILGTILIVNEL